MGSIWSAQDQQEFTQRGWSLDEADSQLKMLRDRGSSVSVFRPCTAGDGIHILSSEERHTTLGIGSKILSDRNMCSRFIPASGAASRMFAALQGELLQSEEKMLQQRAQDLPFWSNSQRELLESMSPVDRSLQAREWMIDPKVGWGHLPKGLIPFHRYPGGQVRSCFEEHFREWKLLAGDASLHFTVPQHYQQNINSLYQRKGVTTSIQSPSTDTLAWDIVSNAIARNSDGTLLFRPGGHGALLTNLGSIKTSFILIRNIDNVVPGGRMAARNKEQQILLGQCAKLVQERDALLSRLDCGAPRWLNDANEWLRMFDTNLGDTVTVERLIWSLDRPIRVAGMVVNEGAPGGGPFWIRKGNGRSVPSIVESSELPSGGLNRGTHYNPVDIVCNLQRFDGNRYNLQQFADQNRYLTCDKDWHGNAIRILERPGLWNGGMDEWLTQFIEVPSSTFAPVKTVFDLLDPIRRN